MAEREGEGGTPRFHRRSLLLSVGAGFGAAIAGCTMLGNSSQSTPTGTEPAGATSESTPTGTETATETRRESTPPERERETEPSHGSLPRVSDVETVYYTKIVAQTEARLKSPDAPIEFADLSSDMQLAVANAIIRREFYSGEYLDGPEEVRYEDSTFGIKYGSLPYGAPVNPGGAGWQPPLSLEATVENGSFVVSVTNELDEPFPVHHYSRPSPYFSILVAVSDDPTVLPHDGYEAMEALRWERFRRIPSVLWWAHETRDRRDATDTGERPTETEALPSLEAFQKRLEKSQVTWIDPGESLRESYGLPSDLSPESKVWVSLPIGDDSTELTDGTTWTLTATITLET